MYTNEYKMSKKYFSRKNRPAKLGQVTKIEEEYVMNAMIYKNQLQMSKVSFKPAIKPDSGLLV